MATPFFSQDKTTPHLDLLGEDSASAQPGMLCVVPHYAGCPGL